MSNNRILLGSGVVFPFVLNDTGGIDIKEGTELIRSSILNILAWSYGNRYFLGQFGTKIDRLIEKPTDSVTLDLVREYVIESINQFETRIKLIQVSTEVQNETVYVYLKYRVIQDNTTDSFIIPFYSQVRY